MQELSNVADYYQSKYGIQANQSVKDISEANLRLSREPAVTQPPQTQGNEKMIESSKGLVRGKNLEAYS